MRRLATAVLGVVVLSIALSGCLGLRHGAADPVASVDDVSGVNTVIKLDPGFATALTTLGLAPGSPAGRR